MHKEVDQVIPLNQAKDLGFMIIGISDDGNKQKHLKLHEQDSRLLFDTKVKANEAKT